MRRDSLPYPLPDQPQPGHHPSRRFFLQGTAGAVALAFGTGTLTACGGQSTSQDDGGGAPGKGGVIDLAINTDVPTVDWTSSTATITRAIAWHIFEQLFAFDKDYKLRPMLAEGYEVSDDELTYTINLRKGIKFHDGAPLTAEDAAASIKRWGKISGGGILTLEYIDEIKPAGETTLEIVLKKPFAPLIPNLADVKQSLIVIPAKAAEDAGTEPLGDKHLIGTGPYKFVSWSRGQRITLKRYEGYSARKEDWGGLTGKKTAYLDEIKASVVKDAQVRLNQLQTDQSQYSMEISLDVYKSMQSTENVEPVIIDSNAWLAVIFNKARPPFDNVKMRQAANFAVNKKDVGKAAYGSEKFWKMDGSIFFPEQEDLYTTEGTDNYDAHDTAKAKQLLSEAGYKNEKLRLLVTNLYPDHYNAAQVVVKQLKEAGFNIDMQVLEWPTLLTKREEKDAWEMFITSFSPSFDPTGVIWMLPDWPGWYESPKMKSTLDKWSRASSDSEKQDLLVEMNEITYSEVPLVKLVNSATLHGRSSKLKNYEAWIDVRLWNTGL
ncbi:MAG: hypothetical protein GEV07_03995 [Streptosporangiales bacterium]|nr:hypothetical protein [Streptosporangiales bacterium]